MINRYFRSIFLSLFLLPAAASPVFGGARTADQRSDSFDVKHYDIQLDLSNIPGKTLYGRSRVSLTSARAGLDRIRLDMFRLKVDSVFYREKKVSFNYNDSLLHIPISPSLNKGDTGSVVVFYHGTPFVDPSGFGGFAFSNADGGYAYNLGVGFVALPHNLGRAWFPCVDNFTDRSTFSYSIVTLSTHKAFCNGLLLDSAQVGSNRMRWTWRLNQEIPAYLASTTVGRYTTIRGVYNGKTGLKDIQIGVNPADSAGARASFLNLVKVLGEFENLYGPYYFDRIGYVSMPFSGGAMEHATNISYPRYAVTNGINSETLWIHELSHHWWGDLITCRTAEDMWLNEGWASYSESLMTERLYGHKAYVDYVRDNHYNVLRNAHLRDGGEYRAISPMPQKFTYGAHVYNKGADAVHTLRSYLGDSLFIKGVRVFLEENKFKDVSSDDLKKSLEKTTGKNLAKYFNTWIYQPGFSHFELMRADLDSSSSSPALRNLIFRQKRKFAPADFSWEGVTLSYLDKDWKRHDIPVLAGSELRTDWTSLPSRPIFAALNMDGQVADAITREYLVAKEKKEYDLTTENIKIKVEGMNDSAFLYVEHHWIGADRTPNTPWNIRLSEERYWTVDGIWPQGFVASATVNYDGRTPSGYTLGYLDNRLINDNEDSLMLMYRPNPYAEWQEYGDYQKTTGLKTDKFGTIKINNLKKGQYCFAMRDQTAGIRKQIDKKEGNLRIYPNPASKSVNIALADDNLPISSIEFVDALGRSQLRYKTSASNAQVSIDKLAPGRYWVIALTQAGHRFQSSLVVE